MQIAKHRETRGKCKGWEARICWNGEREVTTKTKRWKHGVNSGRELKPKRPRNVLSSIVPLYVDRHVKTRDTLTAANYTFTL